MLLKTTVRDIILQLTAVQKVFLNRPPGTILCRNEMAVKKAFGGLENLWTCDCQYRVSLVSRQANDYNRITAPVYMACKPSPKTALVNGRNYRQMFLDDLKTGRVYLVENIRENGRYYVHITIEEELSVPRTTHNGVVGIDTNPDGLGMSHADYLGQLINQLEAADAIKKTVIFTVKKQTERKLQA